LRAIEEPPALLLVALWDRAEEAAPEEYVWESTPVPEASEKFWFAATVVGPLSETAPVPVEKVEALLWEILPGKETVCPDLPMVMPVWFAVPIEMVPAVPAAVPVSIEMLPELPEVVVVPDWIVIAPELAEVELKVERVKAVLLALVVTVKAPAPVRAWPAAIVNPLLKV